MVRDRFNFDEYEEQARRKVRPQQRDSRERSYSHYRDESFVDVKTEIETRFEIKQSRLMKRGIIKVHPKDAKIIYNLLTKASNKDYYRYGFDREGGKNDSRRKDDEELSTLD